MAFKMRGWSAFKKETNLSEEEQSRITEKNKENKEITLNKVINTETGEVYPQRGKFTKTVKSLEKGKPVKQEKKQDKKPHSPRFHGLSPERITEIKAKESKKGVTKGTLGE